MSWKNTAAGYGHVSRALHWLVVLLMAAAFVSVELHEKFAEGSAMEHRMMLLHFSAGAGVLALVLPRLLARLWGRTPRIEPKPPVWQTALAHAVHAMLYVLMAALPLSGWLWMNSGGHAVELIGGLTLPDLVAPDEVLHYRAGRLHDLLGNLGYLLIGVHAVAALVHHHLMRDNTLRLMLPRRG